MAAHTCLKFAQIVVAAFALGSGLHAAQAALSSTSQNGISIVSGGVGRDESQQIQAEARNYSLALTFASDGGAYMADVKVTIRDAQGKQLVATTAAGPYLLAALPPGKYQIEAEAAGRSQTRTVDVPQQGQAAERFFWKASETGAAGSTLRSGSGQE